MGRIACTNNSHACIRMHERWGKRWWKKDVKRFHNLKCVSWFWITRHPLDTPKRYLFIFQFFCKSLRHSHSPVWYVRSGRWWWELKRGRGCGKTRLFVHAFDNFVHYWCVRGDDGDRALRTHTTNDRHRSDYYITLSSRNHGKSKSRGRRRRPNRFTAHRFIWNQYV